MLLPSALSCDTSRPTPRSQFRSSLFASPPLSPPPTSHSTTSPSAISGLFTSCRALQSMLSPPPQVPAHANHQLPSPPLAHSEIASPIKLRLRSRKAPSTESDGLARKRITKRTAAHIPRGVNKRRRDGSDDMASSAVLGEESDDAESRSPSPDLEHHQHTPTPSTPKRLRLAPPIIPLGLERSDFHSLPQDNLVPSIEGSDAQSQPPHPHSQSRGEDEPAGEEEWTTEDDRMLVELVLEKLKLSKSEWQDCARSLGRDRNSLGRRWKSLMVNGEVGLKSRQRRTRVYNSWR
ncbi:hypothetical protein BP6252_05303 [Coleophoma cylindrospora]|uniref:Myb-like domain-containing protein n=1 Tax=Coleophoma cylindrospora TaxID=1849047 RepID=A0A3D8RTG7_9HELO|nr:hypothetical protein BP6252_05303 [Coleophoma cylindrospora]